MHSCCRADKKVVVDLSFRVHAPELDGIPRRRNLLFLFFFAKIMTYLVVTLNKRLRKCHSPTGHFSVIPFFFCQTNYTGLTTSHHSTVGRLRLI